jgi:hypothetical protein
MIQTLIITVASILAGQLTTSRATHLYRFVPQPSIRVAVVGFINSKPANDSLALESTLAGSLTRDPRVTLIDQSMAKSAVAGFG